MNVQNAQQATRNLAVIGIRPPVQLPIAVVAVMVAEVVEIANNLRFSTLIT